MVEKIDEMRIFLQSKGFKDKSIKTYCSILKKVFDSIGTEFEEIQAEQFLTNKTLKPRTYNLYRAVINFYCKKEFGFELKFSKAKVDKTLPTYITRQEFNRVLQAIPNLKHRLGLILMYSSGLRSYEVCRLKKHNIDLDKFTIKVEEAKGGNHRYTVLLPKVAAWINILIKTTDKSNHYLFQTYRGHICERSFQEVLKRGIKLARLHKYFTLHDLRHTFAINLVNKSIDIERVRKLLGHSSLKTTQIYLQCQTINLTELAMSLEGDITK